MVEIKLIIIFILLLIILLSVFCVKYKEHFSFADESSSTSDQPRYRQCQVYYNDDLTNCDSFYEYYQMNEIDLYNIIHNSTNSLSENQLTEITRIYNQKVNGDTQHCKLVLNGWQEHQTGDIKRYSDSIDSNFPLQNECILVDNSFNLTSNSSVNIVDSSDYLYFQNFNYDNIYASICDNSAGQNINFQNINEKYFLNFDCYYNLNGSVITVQDVNFKKTSSDGSSLVDVTDGDNAKIQKGINNLFEKYLLPSDKTLQFRPKQLNVSSYKFSKNFCQIMNGHVIENIPNFTLQDIDLSLSCNMPINDIQLNDKFASDQQYTSDKLIALINEIKADKQTEINTIVKNSSELEITTNATTSDSGDSNSLQNIRNITDSALRNYMDQYDETSKEALSEAINNEITSNNAKLLDTYQNFIINIQNKYNNGYIRNDALYNDDDISIASFDDFQNLLMNNTKQDSNERRIITSTGITGDIFNENQIDSNKVVCTEIAGNIYIDSKYVQFYIEPHQDIEKESIEVFLTFKGSNENRLYQKVAYKYGYHDIDSRNSIYNISEIQKNIIYDMGQLITPYKVSFDYNNLNQLSSYSLSASEDENSWEIISEYDITNDKKNFEVDVYKKIDDYLDNLYCRYSFDADFSNSAPTTSTPVVGSASFMTIGTTTRNIVDGKYFDNINKKTGTHSLIFNNGQNHYLTIPPTNFKAFTGFTMCVWVRFDTVTHYTRIIDFGLGPMKKNIILCRQSYTRKLQYLIATGGTWVQNLSTVNDVIQEKEWMHLVITNRTENNTPISELYVNGEKQSLSPDGYTGAIPNYTPSDLQSLKCYVGKSHWGEGNDPLFKGRMDDFRIYKEALNQEQISRIYHGNLNIRKYPGFVLGDFNEGTGGGTKHPTNPLLHDLFYEKMNYTIRWSNDYGSWKPTQYFNSVRSDHPGGHNEHTYNTSTGIHWGNMTLPGYNNSAYKGEWVTLDCPNPIYPYNLRIYQRTNWHSRVPKDFKFFGYDVEKQTWIELLHETNAIYINKKHVSKPILSNISFKTFGIMVKQIGYLDSQGKLVTSNIVNFDELEIYGGSKPYVRNQKQYRYFKLNYSASRAPNLKIHAPETDVYNEYYINDMTINSGYYGVYIRCLRDAQYANEPINIKYREASGNYRHPLSLNRSYLPTAFKKNEIISKSAENIFDKMLLLNTTDTTDTTDTTTIFNYSSGGKREFTNKDNLTGISNTNFFINCPTMPSEPETNPSFNIEIKKSNMTSIYRFINTMREKQINEFDCLTTDEDFNTMNSVFNTTSSMSQQLIQNILQKQKNDQDIDALNAENSNYDKLKTQIENFKQINVNKQEFISNIVDKNLPFAKYIKSLTKYNDQSGIYIELDTTGI